MRFACLWIQPPDGADVGGPLVHAEVSVGAGAPGLLDAQLDNICPCLEQMCCNLVTQKKTISK